MARISYGYLYKDNRWDINVSHWKAIAYNSNAVLQKVPDSATYCHQQSNNSRSTSSVSHSICIRTVSSPIDHFGTEHFGKSHFGTDVSSREHFGTCTIRCCRRSGRWTFQHGNISTWGLFGTRNFWHKVFSAQEDFGTGTFRHMDISAQ